MEKANSMMEKLGFKDEELKNPKHDDLVLWADQNAESIMNSVIHIKSKDIHFKKLQDAWIKEATLKIEDVPEIPSAYIRCKTWEQPIIKQQYNSKNIIGYADLIIIVRCPELCYSYETKKILISGYEENIIIEAKTEIKSIGELLRQINTYRTYMSGIYVVVCPDEKFKDILESQGVRFIKPF